MMVSEVEKQKQPCTLYCYNWHGLICLAVCVRLCGLRSLAV
jgi:hypothetical protein